MDDLLSLVLTLQPLEIPSDRNEFPRWWGRAGQAALLDIVNQKNQALAGQLHAESNTRPYTASTLMGHFARDGAPLADGLYTLRFTCLTAELSALLLDFAGAAVGSSLELDHLPFRVMEAAHETEKQPWAARTAFSSLGSRFLPGVDVPRRVGFQFTSPVVFKSGGLSQPLPLPGLVFHSLLERWNTFAPIAFAPELHRFAEECLAVSRFDLESRPVPLKEGGMRIGAVGQVTYTATNPDRFWLGQIHTLAAFAQFSGLGSGTAQGLGQCRVVVD